MLNMGTLTNMNSSTNYQIPAGTYTEVAFCNMINSYLTKGSTRGTSGGAFRVEYIPNTNEVQVSNFYNISQIRWANSGSSLVYGDKFSFTCTCRNNASTWVATTQATDTDNRTTVSGSPPTDTRNYSLHSKKQWGAENNDSTGINIIVTQGWNFT